MTHTKIDGANVVGPPGSWALGMRPAVGDEYEVSGSADSVQRISGKRLASVLLLAQVLMTAFFLANNVAPSSLAFGIARMQIVTQMLIGVAFVVVGLDRRGGRPPLLVNGGLLLVMVALVGRFLISDGSMEIYIDNSIRVMLPLCGALVFTRSLDLVKDAVSWIKRYAYIIDICAAVALIFMISARVLGERGYWAGYPVQPLVAFPLIFNGNKVCFRRLALYTLAMAMSGRRMGFISWLLGIFLGAFFRNRGRVRSIVLVSLGIGAIWYVLVISGAASSVVTRMRSPFDNFNAETLAVASSTDKKDPAIGHRMEEIRAELDALLASPASVVIGRDLVDVTLESGHATHGIHCTPVFLLARGGLLWLLALMTLPRYRRVRLEPALYVGAGVMLFGSVAGNSTLDLGFLIALALLAQLRGWPPPLDAEVRGRAPKWASALSGPRR